MTTDPTLEPRGTAPRGRGFNRGFIFGLAILAALLLVAIGWFAFRPLPTLRPAAAPTLPAGGTPATIASLPKDYLFPPAAPLPAPAPAGTAAAVPIGVDPQDAIDRRNRRLAAEKEIERAITSPIEFPHAQTQRNSAATVATTPAGDTNTALANALVLAGLPQPTHSPTLPAAAQLANFPGATPPPDPITGAVSPPATATYDPGAQTSQIQKLRFATTATQGGYLEHALAHPISRYEVKAGTVIPAALLTAVNTDLPGDVTARVTENIYDTRTGQFLLIPQSTLLYGRVNSGIAFGQERIQIAWDRVIFPNGNSIELAPANATDQSGTSGIFDQVDNHYDKIATGIGLSSLIALGGTFARSSNTFGGSQLSIGNTVGDTITQQASQVGQNFVARDLNVQPTLTARQGARIDALVNRDMILEPYRADQ